MKTLRLGCFLLLALSLGACKTKNVAPSATIPERTSPPPVVAAAPQQHRLPTPPSFAEELDMAVAEARAPYARAGSPRLLILFNRDMEDNDRDTMIKTEKVTGGVTGSVDIKERKETIHTGSGTETTTETSDAAASPVTTETKKSSYDKTVETGSESGSVHIEGGAAVYQRVAPDPSAYSRQDLDAIREGFENPFVQAGMRIVDRDTAVRMYGLTEQSVFSYQDLPETQRSQVAGVKQFADTMIAVRVERGEAIERKVSGDYRIEVPRIVARAIRLSDAAVMATATTDDVRPEGSPKEIGARVALILMNRLSNRWRSE